MASFTKTTAAGLLAGLLICLASSELFCRWAAGAGLWYRHWDFTGDLTSLPEVQDRLHSVSGKTPRLLILGDSVLGPTALREHRASFPREQSLSSNLKNEFWRDHWTALSLGADGLLLPDVEALGLEILKDPPQKILLILNMRMFAPEFLQGSKALSRAFFREEFPPEVSASFKPEKPSEVGALVENWSCRHWVLFRTCNLLKTLWYFPSRKDFFQSLLENLGPPPDEDLRQASLKFKIAPYYEYRPWDADSIPFQSLDRFLRRLSKAQVPVQVILTPQNLDFLGGLLNRDGFAQNRKFLASFLGNKKDRFIRYEDWSGRYPSRYFLDHCHLTPEGNAKMASDLRVLLQGVKP